jgi:hypothetical protein
MLQYVPYILGALAALGGIVAVMNYLIDRKDRQKKERIEEIKEAVRPIIQEEKDLNRQRHDENRTDIHGIQLITREMFVKVEDLWEAKDRRREDG